MHVWTLFGQHGGSASSPSQPVELQERCQNAPGAKMAAALKLQSLCLQAVHGNSAAAVAAALPSAAKAQITDGEKSLDNF